jgi:hypothetical protein
VIGIKQRIQQYGPKEERTRTHVERGRVVDKGMVPSLDERSHPKLEQNHAIFIHIKIRLFTVESLDCTV